jgi:hypothetical protein
MNENQQNLMWCRAKKSMRKFATPFGIDAELILCLGLISITLILNEHVFVSSFQCDLPDNFVDCFTHLHSSLVRFQGLGPGGSIPVEFHMHHHHHHYVANRSTGSPSPYVTESGSPNFLSSTNNLNYHGGNSGSRSPFAPAGIGGTAGGTSFCKLHGAVLQGNLPEDDTSLECLGNFFAIP